MCKEKKSTAVLRFMNIKFICITFTCIFLTACGDVGFHGQAFIKQGDVVNKLSDMEIRVIDEASFASEEEQFKKNVEIVNAAILNKQNQHSVKDKELQTLRKALVSLTEVEQLLAPLNPPILPTVKSKLEAVEGLSKASLQRLLHEVESLKQGSHPAVYFIETLGSAALSTRTDADGKFSFKVRDPKGRILVASKNQHYWYLRLPEKDSEINLSDSNVYESSCSSCAFAGELNRDVRNKIGAYAIAKMKKKGEENEGKDEGQMAEKASDELVVNSGQLIKRAKAHAKEYNSLIVSQSVLDGLTSMGAPAAQYSLDLKMEAINLQEAVLNSREMLKQYSNELLKRAFALESAVY